MKTLKCMGAPRSRIAGAHSQGHQAIPQSLCAPCVRGAPRSRAVYLKVLLMQPQLVQQIQLLLFRQERGKSWGCPLLRQPQLFLTGLGQLCACREGSRVNCTGGALGILAAPHFSLLAFVLKIPDLCNMGKLEILEVVRS